MKAEKIKKKESEMFKRERVEIMDTTLRDGEQISHGSFSPEWKPRIVKALFEAGVDRVEVCSARGHSKKEQKMLAEVMKWAADKCLDRHVEVLTFLDGTKSVDWVRQAGGKTINLLAKGSQLHAREQLGHNVKRHLEKITESAGYAAACGIEVNLYLEDWSQGMMDSPGFIEQLLNGIADLPIRRIMLCDTMGVLNPWKTENMVLRMMKWQLHFHYDFHGHNDYGLAVANSLAAVKAGAKGIHATVNGLGERTGNAPLDEITLGIRDQLSDYRTDIRITHLRGLGRNVALMSGRRMPPNKPMTGSECFSNTAGVHADGNRKKSLYAHRWLRPEDFGSRIRHSMGKLSGKSNILFNLERLEWKLSDEQVNAVLLRTVRLSDEGKAITLGDLPFVVASVLNQPELIVFEVVSAETCSRTARKATTKAKIKYRGEEHELEADGDGGFDAFMNALALWAKKSQSLKIPDLLDYSVNIPPGGKSSALVHVTIEWEVSGKIGKFATSGVHCDQVLAAIEAASLAVNLCNCGRKR
ncbi:MAG: alpha-isopropylmalate synthase regulatory domain-containing protein [Parcubacteria group bacterium]|jgi:D-citramalate synthase